MSQLSGIRSLAATVIAAGTVLVAGVTVFANTGVPFDTVPIPADNPQNAAKIQLGKDLFWDVRLSSNRTIACGSCHTPENGGSHPLSDQAAAMNPGPNAIFGDADDVFGSIGIHGQTTGRQAPTAIGTLFSAKTFFDGRAGTDFFDPVNPGVLVARDDPLAHQATGPEVSNIEMAFLGRTWPQVLAQIAAESGPISGVPYAQQFNDAFPNLPMGITAAKVGLAIASWERTQIPDQSPFQIMAATANPAVLTPQQIIGWNVFRGQGRCNKCHLRGETGFSDGQFHNIGVSPIEPLPADLGRFNITGRLRHLGQFKTAVLTNPADSPNYFHGGQILTLEDVVEFYDRGGDFHVNQDVLIRPLGLTAGNKAALADFLRNALEDPRVANGDPPFDHLNVVGAPANPLDTANPTIMLSPNPIPGSANGILKVVGIAGDEQNVKKVSFSLDGGMAVDDLRAPYEFKVDTTAFANGSMHSIVATVFDFATPVNHTAMDTLLFEADQTDPDVLSPEVRILTPSGKTPVGGIVKLTAEAFDNIGVTRVEYSVNNPLNIVATGFPPNFAATYDSTAQLTGMINFMAVAFDAAGNSSACANVMANVDNMPGFPKATLPIEAEGEVGLGEFVATGSFTNRVGTVRFQGFELPAPLNPTGRFTILLSSPLGDVPLGTVRPNAAGNVLATLRAPAGDNRKKVFWADTIHVLDGMNLVGEGIVDMEVVSTGRASVFVRIGTLRLTFRTTLLTETAGPDEGLIIGIVTATRVPAGDWLARWTGPGGDFDVMFSPDDEGIVEAEREYPRESLAKALQFNRVLIFRDGVQVGSATVRIR